VSDANAGGPISACSSTDGGTGALNKTCSNANFASITVTAVGHPNLPQPGLAATALSVTSGALTTSDTLTIDVAQTGLSFAGGQASVNLTVGGLTGGAGPVTLTAFGPGGTPMFAHTFTAPDGVTSAAIPVGPITNDVAQFKVTFSGSGQSVNAIISITGTAPTNNMSDLTQPGSVIIFPKFLNLPAVHVDSGLLVPRSEIEIGVVCPVGATCVEHETVKVRFHWVCPAVENVTSNICKETDFDLFLSIDGKLAFPADGTIAFPANQPRVPAAPCARGYLIGWVVDTQDRPIKFDGLVGNAVIRNPDNSAGPLVGSSTGLSAYTALAIQADPALAQRAVIGTTPNNPLTGQGQLFFDGLPGHYTMVTGEFIGGVRFDRETAPGPAPAVLGQTLITFLTLDVLSNLPNNPTFVPLVFTNESLATVSTTNPLFEFQVSTSWEFVCWDQAQLSVINTNLNQNFLNSRKGLVRAGPAVKLQNGAPNDDIGP
jgi:hypothetical protein